MLYRPGRSRQPGGDPSQQLHTDQIISNPAPLPFPTEAKLDSTGETVTLIQTCDWKGNSPANVGVDLRGKQFLATFDEITVTDHRVLPNQAVDALRAARIPAGMESGR